MAGISIIIPTYNETKNITSLIPRIAYILIGYDYELIVVDDSSPDGTAKAARELANDYPVKVLVRPGKLGLSSAVVEGFKASIGDVIGVIDADLQYPPEYIKELLMAFSGGSDIVIGSRYVDGSKIENWNWFRSIVSKGAIMLSSPLTDVKDPTSGHFFLKRSVIEDILFNPHGFKILLEILVKGKYNSVKEIPIAFKAREEGKSKLGIGEYVNYLKLLYSLYGFRIKVALNGICY